MGIKINPTSIRNEAPETPQAGSERIAGDRQSSARPNPIQITDFLAQSGLRQHPYFNHSRVARARTACDMEMAEGDRLAQEALHAFFEYVASEPDNPQLKQMMRRLIGA
jgi:hypothetical protein